MRDSQKKLDFAVNLVESMLFFALDKNGILWGFCEVSQVNFREELIENVRMYFFFFNLMHLALFNYF